MRKGDSRIRAALFSALGAFITCAVAGVAFGQVETPEPTGTEPPIPRPTSHLPADIVLPGVTPTPGASGSPEGAATPERPPLKAISTIVIDPGHGGDDAGARSADAATPLLEKDLDLTVAQKIEAALTAETSARVLLTRAGDVHTGLTDRTSFANEARADLLISIHANGSPSPRASGFRVYYHDPSAEESLQSASGAGPLPATPWSAAQREHQADSARFAEFLRASLAEKLVLPDRGVKRIPLGVLEGATCPAVLLEMGFLTNQDEALALSRDAVQDALAAAVVDAVQKMDAAMAAAGKGEP